MAQEYKTLKVDPGTWRKLKLLATIEERSMQGIIREMTAKRCRDKKVDEHEGSVMEFKPFPRKKYQIIYADPPWDGLGWNNGSGRYAPARHYPVQDTAWIKNLPVSKLAKETCALFLWVTYPNLPAGLDVIKGWGFKYATCAFTWIKTNPKNGAFFMGLGNYTRANAELCLLGTKGNCQKIRVSRSVRQLLISDREQHSEKPPEARNRIIELFGNVPKIELFARQRIPGWDVWGNEV